MENTFADIPNKTAILERITTAKNNGSGYGIRFSKRELASILGRNDNEQEHIDIFRLCVNVFGADFYLVMPAEYVCFEKPINLKLVAKFVVELVWHTIDERKKLGTNTEISKQDVFQMFGFADSHNMPIDLMMFENAVDTMNPEEKFVRHTANGDMLYSTNEFNSCYKFFTYAGLSPKTVASAWKKVCDAKMGNLVRFSAAEIGYTEASELFKHRTKTFNDTETAYDLDMFFRIMPNELVKETSPEFDVDKSKKFFSKIIYMGECAVKYAPYIVKCDRSIFKQNVMQHGAQAVEEAITKISRRNNNLIEEAKSAKDFIVRNSMGDLMLTESQIDGGVVIVKPTLFQDVNYLMSLFSVTANDDKNANIAIAIMRHSREFCDNVSAVATAIGATAKAYDFANEKILPDKIIVISIVKRLEDDIRLGKNIEVSPRLVSFADTIACEPDYKLVIKALAEFAKLDSPDAEMRNAVVQKINEILMKK